LSDGIVPWEESEKDSITDAGGNGCGCEGGGLDENKPGILSGDESNK